MITLLDFQLYSYVYLGESGPYLMPTTDPQNTQTCKFLRNFLTVAESSSESAGWFRGWSRKKFEDACRFQFSVGERIERNMNGIKVCCCCRWFDLWSRRVSLRLTAVWQKKRKKNNNTWQVSCVVLHLVLSLVVYNRCDVTRIDYAVSLLHRHANLKLACVTESPVRLYYYCIIIIAGDVVDIVRGRGTGSLQRYTIGQGLWTVVAMTMIGHRTGPNKNRWRRNTRRSLSQSALTVDFVVMKNDRSDRC
jgi:hypothetical protein